MDKVQLKNDLDEIKKEISEKKSEIKKAKTEKKSDEFITSLNLTLVAFQEKENILLQRESQGNLFKLYTTNLI